MYTQISKLSLSLTHTHTHTLYSLGKQQRKKSNVYFCERHATRNLKKKRKNTANKKKRRKIKAN